MAEEGTVARDPAVHVYRTIIGSRIRSQLAYRTSFWLNATTSIAVGVIEFVELYVILANVPVFGGLNLRQAALVYALANAALPSLIWRSGSWIPCRATCAWVALR